MHGHPGSPPFPPIADLLGGDGRHADQTLRGELLDLALRTAEVAGEFLLGGAKSRRQHVGTKSSGTDMVTEMDRAAEALILATLGEARPHDAVLAEEGGAHGGTSGVRWVIDPLDGTTNYLYRHPRWAVSIAAEIEGRAVAGVVFDPSADERYWATLGGGAFCNGERIGHSGQTDLAQALVATGFSYDATMRGRQGEVVARLLPLVRDVRRHGAASLDLCWLARGRVDAYFEGPLEAWDVAAGNLIASEAGAWVGALDGLPAGSHSALGAAPALARSFVELLAAVGAPVAAGG